MKRKIMMVGLAMAAGLPHAVSASNAREGLEQGYSSWNSAYMPHCGAAGLARPLMDHVSVADARVTRNAGDAWQLEFAPPVAVFSADDPLAAGDKRLGFNLKLGF